MPQLEAAHGLGLLAFGVPPIPASSRSFELPQKLIKGNVSFDSAIITHDVAEFLKGKLPERPTPFQHLHPLYGWRAIQDSEQIISLVHSDITSALIEATNYDATTDISYIRLSLYDGFPSRRLLDRELFPTSWLMNFEIGKVTRLGDGVVTYTKSGGWQPSQQKGEYFHPSRVVIRQVR